MINGQELFAAVNALPETQQWRILEAKCAFYAGPACPFPNDLTDEAAAVMMDMLQYRLETRPRKESR